MKRIFLILLILCVGGTGYALPRGPVSLKKLVQQSPLEHLNPKIEKINAFMLQYERRPRTLIHRQHRLFAIAEMTAQEQKEGRLGRQIYYYRHQARKNPHLQQDPAIQKILQLFAQTSAK